MIYTPNAIKARVCGAWRKDYRQCDSRKSGLFGSPKNTKHTRNEMQQMIIMGIAVSLCILLLLLLLLLIIIKKG